MATTMKQSRRREPKAVGTALRNGFVVQIVDNVGQFELPKWVVNHSSFRRWAKSDRVPEHGRFSYLDGKFWLDLSMERLIHNQVKIEIGTVLRLLVQTLALGYYFGDGMLITNVQARLSNEPYGCFFSYESLRRKRVRLRKGDDSKEIEGSLDMVLEVVSPSSVAKDREILPRLYLLAGVQEYWLVDSREEKVAFDILQRKPAGYVAARKRDGWIKSEVFGKSFRLTQSIGVEGLSDFRLQVR
jgi:Uma2 family endonuclease